jgi:hypothetical protein
MKIDLAEQYKLFLDRMALDEEKMHPEQKKQIKQTFYFSWAQCIITTRDMLGVEDMSEDDAVDCLKDQLQQVGQFVDTIMNREQ